MEQLIAEFYVLFTVHLGIMLVNNQLDAQFFFSYMFIPNLYMFRALMCSSSGELIVSIRHPVYVTLCRWPSGMQVWVEFHPDLHTRRSPAAPRQRKVAETVWLVPDAVIIYVCSWWWVELPPETCRARSLQKYNKLFIVASCWTIIVIDFETCCLKYFAVTVHSKY
jgi:hypothetical protein